ncbi:hypothetical protein DPMN_098637 [Dreissena polymorpha]|uniref:Uncharacterized protein n=1 Tax=Dreissena polymorpha TaxID=45954 RepID=A0A9D4LCH6_DREPO|nr:hypothetical protein DPMN_098637 [Dreissena polymorpha]
MYGIKESVADKILMALILPSNAYHRPGTTDALLSIAKHLTPSVTGSGSLQSLTLHNTSMTKCKLNTKCVAITV